jgi:hypothetical protein
MLLEMLCSLLLRFFRSPSVSNLGLLVRREPNAVSVPDF